MNIKVMERVPEVGVQWHPFSEIFPWIEGLAFEELKADIAKNGVIEPVVFLGGAILDGRNRYMAARDLKIEYPRVEFEGDDPLAFVLAKNLSRRHLNDRQRADVAAKLAKLPKGANQHPPIGGPSLVEAARIMDVPVKAVERSKIIQEHATPELKAAYEAGEVSQSAAAEVAGLPKCEQTKIVAEGSKAVREAAKQSRQIRGKKPDLEVDPAHAEARDSLPQDVKDQIAARETAISAKKKPGANTADQTDRIEELEAINESLTADNAALQAKVSSLEPMRLEYERGGFAEVIKGMAEQIRVLKTRVETESQEKVKNLRAMDFWKKEAIKLGYSRDEVIDLEAANG